MGPEYCIYLAMRNVGLLALDCHALSEDLDVVDFNPRGSRERTPTLRQRSRTASGYRLKNGGDADVTTLNENDLRLPTCMSYDGNSS